MCVCVCVCVCSTELTPENPLWVGAWWIGFLAGGAATLIIALPILGYPRQLPGNCRTENRTTTQIMQVPSCSSQYVHLKEIIIF